MNRPASAFAFAIALGSLACMPRPRMCSATSECSRDDACVAGRCQVDKATGKPLIDGARRLVVRPVDVAYVRRGGHDVVPPMFPMGRDGGILLLRFAIRVPSTASIAEAYVVLARATSVDADPDPVVLHATRIVEAWNSRSTSWAMQPRIVDTHLPSTTVDPAGPALVRVDVRDLVRQWAKHDPSDEGLAIVADVETRTGTTFALARDDRDDASTREESGSRDRAAEVEVSRGPYLELYLK